MVSMSEKLYPNFLHWRYTGDKGQTGWVRRTCFQTNALLELRTRCANHSPASLVRRIREWSNDVEVRKRQKCEWTERTPLSTWQYEATRMKDSGIHYNLQATNWIQTQRLIWIFFGFCFVFCLIEKKSYRCCSPLPQVSTANQVIKDVVNILLALRSHASVKFKIGFTLITM